MDSTTKKYIVAAGAIGISYFLFNYFSEDKHKPISLDLTIRITRQIKYQMMIVSVSFAESIKNHVQSKTKGTQAEVINFLLDEISKVYKTKQQIMLQKYVTSEQSFKASLKKYENDPTIKKNQAEIIEMMQRASVGKPPNLQIPVEVFATFSTEKVKKIYKQLCVRTSTSIIQKIIEEVDENPHIDPSHEIILKKAINKLSIYDEKGEYLSEKGFKTEWGIPNEVFFKLIETYKLQNYEYKKEITLVEKAYEKLLQLAATDPKSINTDHIQNFFQNVERKKTNLVQSMGQPSRKQEMASRLLSSGTPMHQSTFMRNQRMEQIPQITEKNSSQGEPLIDSGQTNPKIAFENQEQNEEALLQNEIE